MLGLIITILLVLLFVSLLNHAAWGVAPGGLLGVLLIIALIVLLTR